MNKGITKEENIISTITDGTICAVTLGISANYPELALAMSAISSAANVFSFSHVRDILVELASRIDKMRDDNVTMEYLSSPQFAMDIKQLLYEQNLEDLEQKRLWYANYFESCCRCSNVEKIKSQKYFKILRELDLLEFSVMKELPSHPSIKGHIRSTMQRCIPYFAGITIEDVNMQLESLTSKGLVKQISSQEMESHLKIYGNIRTRKDQLFYYKSILGEKFLNFVCKEQ
jgi:hypothetical protein